MEIKMKYLIDYKKKAPSTLTNVINKLPPYLGTRLTIYLEALTYRQIDEIRLKANSFLCLIADYKNIVTDIYISTDVIEECFNALCNYSIYAHFDTIKKGYINVGNGIRACICGKATIENDELLGIHNISSINIRIPNKILNASNYLFNLLEKTNFSKSVLLYSAPGVGKTSILRDLILKIEDVYPKIRYSIIDTKEEITSGVDALITGDIFLSYPKGLAIELATKGMTPQYILCDEISSYDEATSIQKALNCGVKIVATTHAGSKDELLSKEILKGLINDNVFDYALGVYRNYGERHYQFELTELKI